MALPAPNSEADWTEPATKGDLLLLQADLNGKITKAHSDLNAKIKDLRVEIAGLKVSMVWMMAGVVTVLGGLITIFEFVS